MTTIERLDEQADVINVALERIDLIIQNEPKLWLKFKLTELVKNMQNDLTKFSKSLSEIEQEVTNEKR